MFSLIDLFKVQKIINVKCCQIIFQPCCYCGNKRLP